MPASTPIHTDPDSRSSWTGDVTGVPFWVYQDQDLLKIEQDRVFEGPVWNFLCHENEIADFGDWRATVVGRMPVVVVRDTDGSIAAFENRCVHRGALICLDNSGAGARDFQCVYHAWRYDLRGNLRSIAFQRGVNGEGGMPLDFKVDGRGPRKLRVSMLHGLVFGTLSDGTPPIEDFIGSEVMARFDRILGGRKIEIIGHFVEVLPYNWKLYAENVRDTYHASLLHLFFATFNMNRLTQGGGMIVSPNGGCHVSESFAPTVSDDQSYAGMRSVDEDFKLEDSSLMDVIDEHPDRVRHQIVSTFPNLVLQKTQNIMTLRSFAPVSVDSTHLHWFYLGYADDTPEMRKRRLRQLNIGGPAGFASMEDGCVGGFVERGIATADDASSIVKMGGVGIESQTTRATESSVRGFWSLWRGMMGGMSTLLRVAELNAAYAAVIDTDRLEQWPDFFVNDCLYKITSAENRKRGYSAGIVYADSRAMLRDRITALRTANIYERQNYRHIVGLPVIGTIGSDGITAEVPFMVARIMRDGPTDLFATGVYLDKIHDDNGDLRFAERIVVCDSTQFDTLLAIPL